MVAVSMSMAYAACVCGSSVFEVCFSLKTNALCRLLPLEKMLGLQIRVVIETTLC
jgi:hypothetical protein